MFSDPQAIMPYLGLEPGARVADFGSGSGHYSLAMARRLAEISQGASSQPSKVYAVEVQKELLERLEREARSAGIRNIQMIWGNIEKPGGVKLADGTVDLVLLANVLFQTDHRYSAVLEAKRVLRSGGRLAIVDWSGSFGGLGPNTGQVLTETEAKKVAEQAGLKFQQSFPAGANHYGLLFNK